LKVFGGVAEVARLSLRSDFHHESPPFAAHVIDLHLSGLLRTGRRIDGGRALEALDSGAEAGKIPRVGQAIF
jgi:hypothetical protein